MYVMGYEGWRRQQNSKTVLNYEPKESMLWKGLGNIGKVLIFIPNRF
jgi:hypothetical protein